MVDFEKIDQSIYKTKANCTCCITTSEERIQLWTISCKTSIFQGQFNTVCVHKKDDSDVIFQTEFIVSDVRPSDSKDEDDFLYKVNVYIQSYGPR